MPVRSIPPNGRSITGRLACYSTGQSHGHESLLERDCLLLCSFDPEVISVETQPVRITYEGHDIRGRVRSCHYTPDLLVCYKTRPNCLIEVKYVEQLRVDIDALRPKIRAGARYAHRHGWHYRVYTERRIRGVRLKTIQFLRPYMRESRDEESTELLLAGLARSGSTSVSQLLSGCAGGDTQKRAKLLPSLWRAVAALEIGVDLDTPLSMQTALWLLPSTAKKNRP